MSHHGTWRIQITPTLQTSAPRQIGVFVVQEQTLIENSNCIKVCLLQQDRPTTPSENVNCLFKLSTVTFKKSTIAAESALIQI
jgi:hypothetical protein